MPGQLSRANRKASRTLGEAADGADVSPPPGLEAPPGLSLTDRFTAPTTAAAFSPVSLICALNLSIPSNPGKLEQLHADARKMSRTLTEAADAGKILSTPPGLEAPPVLLPADMAAPPGLAPPAGLALLNKGLPTKKKVSGKRCSGKRLALGLLDESCPQKKVSGSDDFVESDDEVTSAGAGSRKESLDYVSSDLEETEPEAEEFQMKADAPVFVPGLLSDTLPSEKTAEDTPVPSLSDTLAFLSRGQKTPLRTPPWQKTPSWQKTPLRKGAGLFMPMLSTHETARMPLPVGPLPVVQVIVPGLVCSDQVQQGGKRLPFKQGRQYRGSSGNWRLNRA